MKVLVIGSGGREHAIIDKLSESSLVDKIYAAPGNDGMAKQAELVAISDTDVEALVKFALEKNIDLTVVGPEVSLAAGVVDAFKAKGLKIFGPDKKAARIESSKEYAKELMKKYHIPTADFQSFSSYEEAWNYVQEKGAPIVIKYDGNATLEVSLREGSPTTCTIDVHLHAYARTTCLIVRVAGIGHNVAFQRSTAVALCHLNGIEFVGVGIGTFTHALYTPLEAEVRGKHFLSLGRSKELVDGIHVALAGNAYHATISISVVQAAQQRILLVGLLDVGSRHVCCRLFIAVLSNGRSEVGSGLCCVGLLLNLELVGLSNCFCRVGGSLVLDAAQCSSKFCVEVNEERSNLLCIVGLPELEVSAALQQLTYAFGFLNARHFDHDAAFLTFEGLDVRLYDTEAVDTCAEYVVRIVNGALNFSTKHALDFLVCALCCHLVAQLLCCEEFGESLVGLESFVVLYE
jgi:hypothetical protein